MEKGQKHTLVGVHSIIGANSNGPRINLLMVDGALNTQLDAGMVVLIEDGAVKARWDGTTQPTYLTQALGIVAMPQESIGDAVSVLRTGTFIREKCVIADDTPLTTSAEFVLTHYQLWAEGEW